jgi:molybdopterin-guanine dinucleotide biosynthesis protein A
VSRAPIPATAIVLAGGRARRFGRDKLAEPLAGRSMLQRAIDAVAEVVVDIVVAEGIADGPGTHGDADPRGDLRAPVPLRRIADRERSPGPLVALAAALEVTSQPIAVVVAGDMPTLREPVLAALLRALAHDPGAEAACLVHRGRRQPLPAALRVGAATTAARRLVADGERRLQALTERLAVRDLAEADWRPHDPEAASLRDIDRPADLDGLPPLD